MDLRPTDHTLLGKNLRNSLEVARNRLIIGCIVMLVMLMAVVLRLFDVMVFNPVSENFSIHQGSRGFRVGRANIVDRAGAVLATSITTSSLYANAPKVINPKECAKKIRTVLPQLNEEKLLKKLTSKKTFIWLSRHLTPDQQEKILRLGLPGISFMNDTRRVYPYGPLTAHLVGMTDVDGVGVSGLEKQYDQELRSQKEPISISVDLNVQHIVHDALRQGMQEFKATGAGAMLIDFDTNEVLAMVSLPDFDPNKPVDLNNTGYFNKVMVGMYEMGSTMKILNTAMALDYKLVGLDTRIDTSPPLKIGRFTITDYRANHGVINVAEILVYSSNKGAAAMARMAGADTQQEFFKKLGLMDRSSIELPESAAPLVPRHWRDANVVSASYGYGIAISPSHLLNAVSTIIGGGCKKKATLKKGGNGDVPCERIVSPEVSKSMLQLMRYVVTYGTSSKAEIPGYFVAGKTGTRDMLENGRYRKDKVSTTFIGVLGENQDKPKYIMVLLLEGPQGTKQTFGFTTAGWNAAPISGRIMARVAMHMGLKPTKTPDRISIPFFKQFSFKKEK